MQKSSKSGELDSWKQSCRLLIISHTWASLQTQNTLNKGKIRSPWGKILPHWQKWVVSHLPSLPPVALDQGFAHFHGLLDVSEITLIPRNPKCHCGTLVRVGAYEDWVINGFWLRFSYSVSLESPHLLHGRLSNTEMCNWNRQQTQSLDPDLWSERIHRICLYLQKQWSKRNTTLLEGFQSLVAPSRTWKL